VGGGVGATDRPLYPRECPGAHCKGGWVGPRTGLDGCGKSCLYLDLQNIFHTFQNDCTEGTHRRQLIGKVVNGLIFEQCICSRYVTHCTTNPT
jgi:hypothetical protein